MNTLPTASVNVSQGAKLHRLPCGQQSRATQSASDKLPTNVGHESRISGEDTVERRIGRAAWPVLLAVAISSCPLKDKSQMGCWRSD